jgi:hypothetical protein
MADPGSGNRRDNVSFSSEADAAPDPAALVPDSDCTE